MKEKREAVIDPDTGEILGYVRRTWDKLGNQHHLVVAETKREADHARRVWENSKRFQEIKSAHYEDKDEDETEISAWGEEKPVATNKRLGESSTTNVTVRFVNEGGGKWVPDLVMGKEGKAIDIVQDALTGTDPDRMPLVRRAEDTDAEKEREARNWHQKVASETADKSQAEANLDRLRINISKGRFAFLLGAGGMVAISFASTLLPLFATIVLSLFSVMFIIGGGATMANDGKELRSQIKKRDHAQANLDGLYANMPKEL